MMFTGKNVLSVGIASLAIAISPGRAVANQHPHPHKGSLEAPALGTPITGPMPVKDWSLPGLNAGHP